MKVLTLSLLLSLPFATSYQKVVVTKGCMDPDVGALQVPFCTDEDTDPDREVSYAMDIAPLFARSVGGCVMCHIPTGPSPIGISIGGLDLSDYDTLMDGGVNSSSTIVVPGAPCDSELYLKLTAAPPTGARMPANGPPFFTSDEMLLVHDWIAEGGLDN